VSSASGRTERTSRAVKALLLSPIVVLFASATRLLIISNYDTTTATAMASSAGVVGTLLGTIIPILPLFLPALLVFLIVVRRWALALLTGLAAAVISPAYRSSFGDGLGAAVNSGRSIWVQQVRPGLETLITGIPWLGPVLHFLWTVTLWPLDFVVYIGRLIWNGWGRKVLLVWSGWPSEIRWVVVCALAALVWVFLDPPGKRRGSSTAQQADLQGPVGCLARFLGFLGIAYYSALVAIICAVSVLFVQKVYKVPFNTSAVMEIFHRPWLPTERITLSSGGDPVVGYTLSTSDGWHVLLLERTRTIRYLRAAEVAGREVCHLTPLGSIPPPLIKQQSSSTIAAATNRRDDGKAPSCYGLG
jgi:hypothetical protein